MKNLQICLLVLLAALFAGCETEGKFRDTSYYNPQVTFNPTWLQGDYRITYNGSESPYVSKSEKTFELEIFRKDDATDTPVLAENECPSDKAITLFRPVGSELAVYTGNEDKYTTFTPTIIFSGNKDDYTATFNNGEIEEGETNYIAKDNLTGTFRIVRKADNTILYEEEITLEADGTLQFMQLSDTEFLEIPESDEPDPESRQYTKIRFFYTADAFPEHDKLRLVVYLMDLDAAQFTEAIATIELEAGKISEYIQIDNDAFGQGSVNGVYDLIDENGNMIVDNTQHFNTSIQIGTSDNKFMTFRFVDPSHQGGDNVGCSRILYTPWE